MGSQVECWARPASDLTLYKLMDLYDLSITIIRSRLEYRTGPRCPGLVLLYYIWVSPAILVIKKAKAPVSRG